MKIILSRESGQLLYLPVAELWYVKSQLQQEQKENRFSSKAHIEHDTVIMRNAHARNAVLHDRFELVFHVFGINYSGDILSAFT